MYAIFAILNSVVAIIFLGIHVTPRFWCDMYINKTALLVTVSSLYWFVCVIKCVFMTYTWKLVHHYTHTWILLRIHVSMRGLCDSYVIGNSLIMFPAVDKHLTQQIRYVCLISFDYVSLFIFLCVRYCKGFIN